MYKTYIGYNDSVGDYEIHNASLKATVMDIGGGQLVADIDGLIEVGVKLDTNGEFTDGDRVRLVFDDNGLCDIEKLD